MVIAKQSHELSDFVELHKNVRRGRFDSSLILCNPTKSFLMIVSFAMVYLVSGE